MSNRLRAGIAIVITAVWSISFLVDIISTKYEPSPFLHAIMMVVAGAAFTGGLVQRNDDNNRSEKGFFRLWW